MIETHSVKNSGNDLTCLKECLSSSSISDNHPVLPYETCKSTSSHRLVTC